MEIEENYFGQRQRELNNCMNATHLMVIPVMIAQVLESLVIVRSRHQRPLHTENVPRCNGDFLSDLGGDSHIISCLQFQTW